MYEDSKIFVNSKENKRWKELIPDSREYFDIIFNNQDLLWLKLWHHQIHLQTRDGIQAQISDRRHYQDFQAQMKVQATARKRETHQAHKTRKGGKHKTNMISQSPHTRPKNRECVAMMIISSCSYVCVTMFKWVMCAQTEWCWRIPPRLKKRNIGKMERIVTNIT